MPTELRTDANAPWKQRFRTSNIYLQHIARSDPTRGLVSSDATGTRQLYAAQLPTGTLTPLTARAEGAWFGVLSPDGKYVYYLDDQKGDEIGHLVRIPFEGGPEEDLAPDLPSYAVPFESGTFGLSISRTANMLGFTTTIEGSSQVYLAPLDPRGKLGERRAIYKARHLVIGPMISATGDLMALDSTEYGDGMQYSILAFDSATGAQIGRLHDPESSVQSVLFSPVPGDGRLLAMTNRSGYNRPVIWHPRTGERNDIALGELDGEIFPQDWSSDGRFLLLKQFNQAVSRLHLYDLLHGTLQPVQHTDYGWTGSVFFGEPGEIILNCDNSTHPSQTVVLDERSGAQKRVIFSPPEVPPGRPFTSVSFPSSDGQMIQAWLGVPVGVGPFPTILETHGGPDSVATSGFWPEAQAWLDHGFAYITVNYRGSTTFGRAFQEQIWGDVGHWEIEDMVAARDWLVAHNIALPQQIFLTGWSNGGYLTLLALGKRPDLWAGGMAGVAVTDLAMSYEDEAETLQAYDRALYKGTPAEKPELCYRASPITYAEQVTAPILIIQGRNDTRCPPRQVEIYEARMKELGKEIEVYWFDAGHVSRGAETEIEYQERMMRFAYQVLEKR